jgi:hypothetical protein
MRTQIVALTAVAVAASACSDAGAPTSARDVEPTLLVSAQGVAPQAFPGNFVSFDDLQVCYDMADRFGMDITQELAGFKVDLPGMNTDPNVGITIHTGGRLLDWTLASGTMLGVVVKGGPNYNFYDYSGTALAADQGLSSPMHGRNRPAISHYNICYTPDVGMGEGCTPGYWRNHADRWIGAHPNDLFDATFDVTSGLGGTYRLGQAIWASGGGINALARHATAGLLNSFGGVPNGDGTTVAYAYTTAQVLAMVKDAIDSGDAAQIEATKNLLEAANEAGCPLSGTRAVPVS